MPKVWSLGLLMACYFTVLSKKKILSAYLVKSHYVVLKFCLEVLSTDWFVLTLRLSLNFLFGRASFPIPSSFQLYSHQGFYDFIEFCFQGTHYIHDFTKLCFSIFFYWHYSGSYCYLPGIQWSVFFSFLNFFIKIWGCSFKFSVIGLK